MSPDDTTVLQLIWSHFKQHGVWPQKLELWSQLQHLGHDLEEFASRAPWLEIGGLGDTVSVRVETLRELPEVGTLLEPLPGFYRFLARRFVEEPNLEEERGSRGPEVNAEAFFRFWKDERDARLAARLMWPFGGGEIGMYGNSDADFYFRPRLGILRYEQVESLDQILSASAYPKLGTVRQNPSGRHLALLQTVYDHIQRTNAWPKLPEFTLQHRERLGHVPDLVVELTPTFIHERQSYEQPTRIHLTANSLPLVGGETGCALALSIVRTFVTLLAEPGAGKEFSIEQLTGRMRLPVEQVLPVAMLLERERWGRVREQWGEEKGWQIEVYKHAIYDLKNVKTWGEYVKARDRNSFNELLAVAEKAAASPAPHPGAGFAVQLGKSSALATPHAESRPAPPSPPRAAPETGRTKVFIGHGNSLDWLALRDFLRDKLGLDPVEFNSTPAAGQHTLERIEQCLRECRLAFLVMNAEDLHMDGSRHARQNVVHEIGLFQAKLGFDKVLILVEEGCTMFSNMAGLTHLSFRKGKIRDCFEDIREAVAHQLRAS
jgi:predicted nucleotide-binding protein